MLQAYGDGRFYDDRKSDFQRLEILFTRRIPGFRTGNTNLLCHSVSQTLITCPLHNVPFLRNKPIDTYKLTDIAGNELHHLILSGKEHPLLQTMLFPDM